MKKLTLNITQIQSIKLQLHLLFNFIKGDSLKPADLEYLAYFILYGEEGKKRILEDAVSVSAEVWHNKLTKFRKMGIVMGLRESTYLNPNIKIALDNLTYNLTINVQPHI